MTIVSFLLTHHGVTCSRAEGLAVSHADEGVEPDPEEDADQRTTGNHRPVYRAAIASWVGATICASVLQLQTG